MLTTTKTIMRESFVNCKSILHSYHRVCDPIIQEAQKKKDEKKEEEGDDDSANTDL